MGQSTAPRALALGVSLSLACGMVPATAFAEEAPASDGEAPGRADAAPSGDAAKPDGYDKADFYSDGAGTRIARLLAAPLARSSFGPMSLSDAMKYFARYESNQNYDQGLSWGDGYHAMGYYQFDNRYALKGFLTACYDYDPQAYSMFGWVASTDISGDLYDWGSQELTDIGRQLDDAWHTAYANNPAEFAGLQDGYAYGQYYVPAENYLMSRGIDISNRSDSLKGLCWGLANLFGTSGWHKFVGGWSDGYVDGTYYTSYDYPGAGLTNDMTDEEFVTTLCDYVVAHVGEFYAGQPQYHEGWENRYREEKQVCLSLLDKPVEKPAPPASEEPEAPGQIAPPAGKPEGPGQIAPPDAGKPEGPGQIAPPAEEPEGPGQIAPPDAGKPSDDPEDEPSDRPQGPEASIPPAEGGGDQGQSDDIVGQGGEEEGAAPPPPEEATAPGTATPPAGSTAPGTTAPPEEATAPAKDEPVKEVVDEADPSLEDPASPAQEPLAQGASENGGRENAAEPAQGASETSSLTQTGDDALEGPLGMALASAGVAAVAGAALATRRVLK